MGKRVYTFPDANQRGPLGNTFPFANVNSLCQMLYLGCPKPKVGICTVAFLVIEKESVEVLLFQLPWPFAEELLVPGPQLSVWAETKITSGLLPSLTLSL